MVRMDYLILFMHLDSLYIISMSCCAICVTLMIPPCWGVTHESRFKEVIQLHYGTYAFECKLEPEMFSSSNAYICYLVLKFLDPRKALGEKRFFRVSYNLDIEPVGYKIAHLNFPEPVNIPIIYPKNYSSTSSHDYSSNIPKTKFPKMPKMCTDDSIHSWMDQRNDGWMEVMLCKPLHKLEDHKLLHVYLRSTGCSLDDIVVQGIEFRPMQRDS